MFVRRRIWILGITVAAVLTAGCATAPKQEITPDEFIEHIKYLASDELGGRGNGTAGLDRAAHYIRRQFQRLRLEPVGSSDYMQYFTIRTGSSLGQKNSLIVHSGEETTELQVREDFIPISFGGEGIENLPVVFAGYGITAPDYEYDDYAGVVAEGKAVLVLALEPQRDDRDSVFDGRRDTEHSMLQSKVLNARNHGASAIIVVTGPIHRRPDIPELPSQRGQFNAEEMGIPGIWAKAEHFGNALERAGISLLETQKSIDEDLAPKSTEIGNLSISLKVDVSPVQRRVANVVGYLPGSDRDLKDEVIVVGAHYDHLGLGHLKSLAPDRAGEVHNGADDNASGIAGMLEIAGKLSLDLKGTRRSILFVAFAGEELGLLGSAQFVADPPMPIENIVAMINLDMIGRLRQNRLMAGGVDTGAEFRRLIDAANRRYGFIFSLDSSGIGASDHASFVMKGIPSLFFFSGVHEDYHRPSDDWDKIDSQGGSQISRFVVDTIRLIDNLNERPKFVEVAVQQRPAAGGGRGGVWFGSVPDFTFQGEGYRFQTVMPGSPAARAGLLAQDVLIEFEGERIKNIYDFTAALRAHQPGDTVDVVVVRNGEKLTISVELARRQ